MVYKINVDTFVVTSDLHYIIKELTIGKGISSALLGLQIHQRECIGGLTNIMSRRLSVMHD